MKASAAPPHPPANGNLVSNLAEAAIDDATMRRRLSKGDTANEASVLSQLAKFLDSVGRHEEALPRHVAALEMQQRLHKGDHSAVVLELNETGNCLMQLQALAAIHEVTQTHISQMNFGFRHVNCAGDAR